MGSGYDGFAAPSPRVTVSTSSWKSASPALRRLVREHLLERSEGLPPASLAAFIAGWGSALQLLRRSHAALPWVSPQEQRAIGELLDAVEAATEAELEDE
jgi:hypothetical protein